MKYENRNREEHQLGDTIQAPKIISPCNYTQFDSICKIVWSCSGINLTYQILISSNIGFESNEVFVTKDTSLTYRPGLIMNQYRYCKVRAFSSVEIYSSWSQVLIILNSNPANIIKTDKLKQAGCNGNCGNCNHPCGRRPQYKSY